MNIGSGFNQSGLKGVGNQQNKQRKLKIQNKENFGN